MTPEFWAILTFAFVLGFGVARGLFSVWPEKLGRRAALLVLIPLLAVGMGPIIWLGWPAGEDWVWVMVIYSLLTPLILAWFLGAGVDAIVRKVMTRDE